jgi:hypothetical protein
MSDLNGAETLYAFMGWLTSRSAVSGPYSASHDAGPAAQLVNLFCIANKLEVHDLDWHKKIVRPDNKLIGPDR